MRFITYRKDDRPVAMDTVESFYPDFHDKMELPEIVFRHKSGEYTNWYFQSEMERNDVFLFLRKQMSLIIPASALGEGEVVDV